MNRSVIIAISAISTLALGLPSSALSQQKSLREQLVGSWMLVSNVTTGADNIKRELFGSNPNGILIVDAGGRYAAVQARPNRPKFKEGGNTRLEVAAAELGEAARGFAANFGTWTVNEADKTFTRRYEGALFPNVEGTTTNAAVSLAGDELTLTVLGQPGVGRTDAVYKRAK
jgi:hypothetical protein